MNKSKNKHYVNDTELMYHLILSKGKGKLTRKAEFMFMLICEKTMYKITYKYRDDDERYDCYQHGQLKLFENWKGFDEKKFNKALPYITELFKRGVTDGFNKIKNKKYYQKDYTSTISIERANDGRGIHTI